MTGAVTFYDRHYQRLGKSKIASGVGADCRGLLGGPVPLHSTPGLPGELRCAQRCPVDRTKPMQSELQVGAPGGQQQRFYLPPGQVAAALGDVAAEMPPQSCSGRHRRSCSGEGCGAGPPARRAHAQVVCRSAARAVESREESPDGLLRWGRMARPWPGIKAGRGGTYLSDAGLHFFSDAGALYPLAAACTGQPLPLPSPHPLASLAATLAATF